MAVTGADQCGAWATRADKTRRGAGCRGGGWARTQMMNGIGTTAWLQHPVMCELGGGDAWAERALGGVGCRRRKNKKAGRGVSYSQEEAG